MRTRLKIAGATATAVFSLATVFTATYAWFATNGNVTASVNKIVLVSSESAKLKELKLVKFDYALDVLGYDYLNPTRGSVGEYQYNESENSFGDYALHTGTGSGKYIYDNEEGKYIESATGTHDWVRVQTMNKYDPVEKIVRGGDLNSLNCNAIYEVTITGIYSESLLSLMLTKLTDESHTPNYGNNEISLSDYIDFDVYFDADLAYEQTYSKTADYVAGDIVIADQNKLYVCTADSITGPESNSFNLSEWALINAYSSSSTYAQNDVVIHETRLYKCNTACSNETWRSAKWDVVETYSNESSYAQDSFTIHNGHIYKCLTAANNEAFSDAKWQAILCEQLYYPSYNLEFEFKGSGVPSNSIGKEGDSYFDTSSNNVYVKNATEWVLTRNVTDEETFYKIAYLSALSPTHTNFYEYYENEFVANGPYDVGDIVFHDGALYECLVQNTDSTWVADHWRETSNIKLLNKKHITFDQNNEIKVYINVNYSPSRTDEFIKNRNLSDTIVAIHDFLFDFNFS